MNGTINEFLITYSFKAIFYNEYINLLTVLVAVDIYLFNISYDLNFK